MSVLLMVIVLGLFVIGGAALLKAHSESEADRNAERRKRKGITPIYKRSSAMDAGLFSWGGSSDGGGWSGGRHGGSHHDGGGSCDFGGGDSGGGGGDSGGGC